MICDYCGTCRKCRAYAEEVAGREPLLGVRIPVSHPSWWRAKPGTAKALATVGRGDDKRRQAKRGAA